MTERSSDGGLFKVRVVDLKMSSGVEAAEGDHVTIQYQAALSEAGLEGGRIIEERDETNPFEATLNSDDLLDSVAAGICGMRDGGSIRRIFLEPEEAFGARGLDQRVPPDSSLVVQVWLRKVIRA